MNNLYEALEVCLQDIEQGKDVESVLFQYPDLAEELRPILEASAGAKHMAVPAPSVEVVRRNRARVLQHAAQMREAKVKPSQRIWFASLRRIAVTLAVVAVLFASGTSLVGASSNTLPGDNLYPVKRTWEGLRLFFTFNAPERDALEVERENERLHEVTELLAEGRSEEVDFNGQVTSQSGNEWVVEGLRVFTSSQTDIDQGIVVGSPVRVRGITQANGTILAERIRLLSSKEKLPDAGEEHESEEANENNSGPGSGQETPEVEETESPENENENSGSGSSNSGSNENHNENANENSNSNENSGNENNEGNNNEGNENNENNGNENEANENNENEGNENEEGGNKNGNENENDPGGEEPSGSGGSEDGE